MTGEEAWPLAAGGDSVNHPKHYCEHPSGVECIEITRHMSFNLGNVVKYVWRAGLKGAPELADLNRLDDLKKARWYLEDEIMTLENQLAEGFDADVLADATENGIFSGV